MFKSVLFYFSLLSGITFNFIGTMRVNEILTIMDLLWVKKQINILKKIPILKKICLLLVFILVCQVFSDMINESKFENFSRGWANIIFSILQICFISYYLALQQKNVLFFFIGDLIKNVIFINSSEGYSLETMGFFKFSLAPILNDLIIVLSLSVLSYKGRRKILLFLMFSLGIFYIIFDYRSNGTFWLISTVLTIYMDKIKKVKGRWFIILIPFILVLSQMIYVIYIDMVMSEKIGNKHTKSQLEKVEDKYSIIDLLFHGRAETIVALEAIKEKPIWGHGSWASDKNGYYTYLLYKLHDSEDKFQKGYMQNNRESIIPSHSILLGLWMNAGVLAFILCLYIFFIVIKSFIDFFKIDNLKSYYVAPMVIYIYVSLIWAMLFSPVQHLRQTFPVMISLIFVCSIQMKNTHAIKYNEVNVTIS